MLPTLALIFANAPTLIANASVCHHLLKMVERTTAAAEVLRRSRRSIDWQRLIRVSKFKIYAYELGAGSLTGS